MSAETPPPPPPPTGSPAPPPAPATEPSPTGTGPLIRAEDASGGSDDFRAESVRQTRPLEQEDAQAFLRREMASEAFHQSLIAAALDGEPDAAVGGVMLVPARHRLVALAAALRLCPDARLAVVPRSPAYQQLRACGGNGWERRLGAQAPDRPLIVGRMGDGLAQLRESVRSLERTPERFPKGILILADREALEIADEEDERLLRPAGFGADTEVVVARLLLAFDPFERIRQGSEADALAFVRDWSAEPDIDADVLLDAFNSRRQQKLRRRYSAWQRSLGDLRAAPDICHKDIESDPRVAVAQFLVAHFDELGPRALAELSDVLVPMTPRSTPAATDARPADAMTDAKLEEAGICFALDDGHRYAVSQIDGDAAEGAEHLKRAFAHQAPLLRERYAEALRRNLTIGHASSAIARDYLDLETTLLGEESGGGDALIDRCRRIVYGDVEGADLARAMDDPRWFASFSRGLDRAGPFLRRAADVTGRGFETLLPAVVATGTSGLSAVHAWHLRLAGALLSWQAYRESAIPLAALPGFLRDGMQHSEDARAMRWHLLAQLRRILFDRIDTTDAGEAAPSDPAGSTDRPSHDDGSVDPARLLDDAAALVTTVGRTDDHASARMFALALANAADPLERHVWCQVPAPTGADDASDRRILDAVASDAWATWLDETPDGRDQTLSAEDLWRLCDATLEVVIGKSALAEFEDTLLEHWLGGDGPPGPSFASRALWDAVRQPEAEDVPAAALAIIGRIRDIGAVLALTLVTCAGGEVRLTQGVQDWLVAGTDEAARRQRRIELRQRVADAQALQRDWYTFLGGLRIGWDAARSRAARALLKDRIDTLAALARLLAASGVPTHREGGTA